MSIEAGVQFLFVKDPICMGFRIPFNKSDSTITEKRSPEELFGYVLFNFRFEGCA